MASLMDLFSSAPPAPPPDPSSLAALMGLGSIDQRYKLLQQKADQANQLSQGTQVDYSKGKGTPLLLAGLANLFSAGLGGYQQGKAQSGLSSLLDKQDAGNTSLAQGMLGAAPPDLSSVLTAGPDALPGASRAASDAIAKRNQAGLMGLLSGSPQIAGASKAMYGASGDEQQTMMGMPQARNQLASGNLDYAAKLRGAQVATSPTVAAGISDLARKLGGKIPEGTSAPEALAMLPAIEKAYEAETKRAEVGKFASDAFGRYSVRTGQSVAGGGAPGGGTGLLDPAALDQAAELYATTGQLSSVGMGNAGSLARRQIMNRAAELHPTGALAENRAGFKADSESLRKAQVQSDSIDSFEGTALKNLDNFLSTAKSISDTGIPLANKPIRAIADSLGGSPKQAQFNAARQVAIQEIGKVLGGAVAGGVVSDSQRHEVEGLMRGDATLEQLQAVAQTLRQDMENRKASVETQIQTIRGRISGKPAQPEQAPAKATHRFNPQTGKIEAIP